MKNIRDLLKNQVPIAQSLDQSQIVKSLPDDIRNLSPLDLEIANFILEIELQHGVAFPSQISIADRFGISREYVNRRIKYLRKIGYINVRQRWNNSLIYTVHPTVMMIDKVHILRRYLPALKKILLGVFLMALGAPISGNVTLTNNKLDIRKKDYIKKAPSGRWSMDRKSITGFINTLPFNLDTPQKVFLCQFPLEALRYASEKLELAPNAKMPWPFFISQCLNYCREEDIRLDSEWCSELRRSYQIGSDVNLKYASPKVPENVVPESPKRETQTSIVPQKAPEPAKISIKQQIADMPRPYVRSESEHSPYSIYKGKQEDSMMSKLERLTSEMEKAERNIELLKNSTNPFAADCITALTNKIETCKQELLEMTKR